MSEDFSRNFSRTLGVLANLLLGLVSISTHLKAQQTTSIQAPGDMVSVLAGDIVQDIQKDWEFRPEGQATWQPVTLPSPFESHQGVGFDGVGWYRKRIPRVDLTGSPLSGKRLLIRFGGAATRATVMCDGVVIAEHLGGWTPFECDLTRFVSKTAVASPTVPEQSAAAESQTCELVVKVDELVGHNSQGFLPVFAPHFGGLWKPIEAAWRAPIWIDSQELFVWGELSTCKLHLEIPLTGIDLESLRAFVDASKPYILSVRYRHAPSDPNPPSSWQEYSIELSQAQIGLLTERGKVVVDGSIEIQSPQTWSPTSPELYEVKVGLRQVDQQGSNSQWIDLQETRAAFREVRVEGSKLLLNGQPLRVRGILNWGYAPPSVAPSLDPEHWRKELQLVKDYGFNLMKFCLWIPPKGYLELADRMGVLVWIEYPTWHSKWTQDALPTLEKEFDEFFCYDRNHPSVILRSLTCETGPSADIEVIRKLYDRCHARIPGSIVEDDSSWIQWNRVHDFYDDHPYGNNHTWVPTLQRLKSHIQDHGIKPLVLGEAIAADTWLNPGSLDGLIPVGEQAKLQGFKRGTAGQQSTEPFWFPLSYRAANAWSKARESDMGVQAVARLAEDSKRYAWLMRKYQIETMVRELPDAGYVVSVIRDFPFASMGLVDFAGQSKWTAGEWDWHAAHLLMLKTPMDRRSFWGDEEFVAQVLVDRLPGPTRFESRSGESSSREYRVRWTWTGDSVSITSEKTIEADLLQSEEFSQGPVEVLELSERLPQVERSPDEKELEPALWKLRVELIERSESGLEQIVIQNRWELWQIPKTPAKTLFSGAPNRPGKIWLHASCSETKVAEILGLAKVLNAEVSVSTELAQVESDSVCIAQRLDQKLIEYLEAGGRLLLIPDGQAGSLPIAEHWFLRGGPIVSTDPFWNRWHRLLVDLQHLDLSGPVVPDLQWLEELTPLVMLWDNHDIATVKTHGLLFATKVGRGVMLVDSLGHGDGQCAVGSWLFGKAFEWLRAETRAEITDSLKPLEPGTLQILKDKLRERTLSLTDQAWRFRPDPQNHGLELGWHDKQLKESQADQWSEISIGKHWEALGYESLDGWAWYRIEFMLPSDWPNGPVYIQVDGADDYIEIYADGAYVGSAGDRQNRQTAFEQKVGFLIKPQGQANERLTIAIRVEDWQGAGGLFRPIRISTTELRDGKTILK